MCAYMEQLLKLKHAELLESHVKFQVLSIIWEMGVGVLLMARWLSMWRTCPQA